MTKARGATLRRKLINVPAGLPTSGQPDLAPTRTLAHAESWKGFWDNVCDGPAPPVAA